METSPRSGFPGAGVFASIAARNQYGEYLAALA
jgi:hypothetical protein